MARGRMIGRGFFTSADLTDQPAWVRILWAGLVVFADDSGLIRDNERFFRGTLLCGLGIRRDRLLSAIGTFIARGMLSICQAKGVSHYQVTNFKTHQKLKWNKKAREDEGEDGREVEDDDGCSEPRRRAPTPPPEVVIPEDLRQLELYAADRKLCRSWPQLLPAWRTAFPAVDVLAEVRAAHAWEVANPERRKLNRSRFLQAWLAKEQDKAKVAHNGHEFNLRRSGYLAAPPKEDPF